MDRMQLKARRIAAPGYGNARFLDEGDEAVADAVVFALLDGTRTVYSTDAAAAPIEATRRSFASDSEAFDYMHQCLRDNVTARRIAADRAFDAVAARPKKSLFALYREIGLTGIATTIVGIATAVGWVAVSPFTYTRDDTRQLYASSDDLGTYIFDAESGVVIVAVCYSLASINMAEQWQRGRHGRGRVARRAIATAVATAFFATVTLICMYIRSEEIQNLLFWLPPLLALLSSIVVALSLVASRTHDSG